MRDEANRSTQTLLADLLGVPVRDVRVVSGRSSRRKRVEVSGISPEAVAQALALVLASGPHEP